MALIKIAVDAYGGDLAPDVNIEGAISVLNKYSEIKIILVGKEEELKKKLKAKNAEKYNIQIVNADDVFPMSEKPSLIIRRKETSLYKAAELVKNGKADALVSAGNTGALLACSLFVIGRIKNVSRAAIATTFPSKKGFSILLDSGANSEVKPEVLESFGEMGLEYAKFKGNSDPLVGLLNVGEEEEKGTEIQKQANKLLREKLKDSFAGNVEGRDILLGDVDVIVAGGFEGNIALKTMEGTLKFFSSTLKENIKSSGPLGLIGGLLLKKTFNKIGKKFDPSEIGGAFILGVKNIVVKAHGNSNSIAIMNAIRVASEGVEKNLVYEISKHFGG
ncbi:MAG: phosphate acyltransferase [Kosmotogales bacterium]|nr:phosphate acyltransferase [Kosmotogales bacterium]